MKLRRWALVLLASSVLASPLATPLGVAAQGAGAQAAARLGLTLSSDHPMKISAEELEANRDANGAERITFRGDVRVRQQDVRMQCSWLEALYGDESGRPQFIHAKGDVVITQQDTTVTCAEATYDSRRCRLICSDPDLHAELRRGEDVLFGRDIEFDLCKGLLKVRGGARIQVTPRPTPAPVQSDDNKEAQPDGNAAAAGEAGR